MSASAPCGYHAAVSVLRIWLASAVLLGAALLWVFLGSTAEEPAPSAAATPSATSAPLVHAPSPESVQPAAPSERAPEATAAPRLEPAATPPPPEPQGLEDGAPIQQPAGDFSWKYANATPEQRRSALRNLQRDYERALARGVERRIQAGRFEEAALESLDLDSLLAELNAAGAPFALVTVPGNRPVRSADDAEGATAVRWMRFERFDEAALFELGDELDWLRRASL